MKKVLLVSCLLASTLFIGVEKTNAVDLKAGMKNMGSNIKATSDANTNAATKDALKKQIQVVIKKSDDITATYDTAIEAVAQALLSKQEIDRIKASAKVSKKSTESNSVKTGEYIKALDELAADETKAVEQVKGLSAEKTSLLMDGLYNVLLANLGYLDVAAEATNLLAEIANDPASAISLGSEFKALKQVVTNVPKQAKQAGVFGKNMISVLKKSGIKFNAPVGASAKPKAIKVSED